VFVPALFTKGCSLLGIVRGVSQRGVGIFHSNQPKIRTHARLRAGPEETGWYGGPDLGLTRRSYGRSVDRIAVAAPRGPAHAARASPPPDALGT
jgi:hypothetical protein